MSNLRDTLTQREEIPLLSAAAYGDLAAVKYLIEEKAVQIDCTNSKEETPLLLACCYGHVESWTTFLTIERMQLSKVNLARTPCTTFPASHLNTSTGLQTGCGQAIPH
jgi:ankyrin repeat protein